MPWIAKQLHKASVEQLHALSQAIDRELDRRAERRIPRGYQRTTYMNDLVRGERRAPRGERALRRAA